MADWLNRIVGYGTEAPDQLLANPLNFRIHPKQQQAATEGSLETLGWIDDVIVNKTTGHVVDGHLRVQLALRHGAESVPVKYVELTEEEERQALLSLDPIAAMAATDKAKLDGLIRGVQSDDKRVQEFIAELAEREGIEYGAPPADDPGAQIDKAEELRVKWGVESGQMWKLGEHRLICGDCTDKATVERVMGGERAQITFTSPPYWLGKDYEYQKSLQEVKDFIKEFCEAVSFVTNKDGGRIIINTSTASARAINEKADTETLFTVAWYQDAFRDLDWLMRHCRIWLKHGDMGAPSVAARSDVVDQHWEVIPEFLPTFYFPDGLRRGQEKIGMKWAQLGVWDDIPGERSAGGVHCAAFPVELPRRYINLYTKEGEIILDPFLGSGTTLIACERLGRKCRAVEISPAYCAAAIQRWVDMTGGTPELIA